MRIKELFKNAECKYRQIENIKIKGIAADSRLVKNGYLFVAQSGTRTDGHNFVKEAFSKNAAFIIGERSLPDCPRYIKVSSSRKILAILADNFYRHPSKKLKLIGITGTNGKTTTSYLIYQIISAAGFLPALIGTIAYQIGNKTYKASHTTPDALKLHYLFSQMRRAKNNYCVIEVSSHALEQQRTYGIDFSAAVFTNLTRDHLDYHKNFKNYYKAKKILFENLTPRAAAIINTDDFYGRKIIRDTSANVLTYGCSKNADIRVIGKKPGLSPSELYIATPRGRLIIQSRLFGRYNIYNILAAVGCGIVLGFSVEVIKKGVEDVRFIKGRLQPVDFGQPFKVFVDYAHTDDALKNVLLTIRAMQPKRIILVFGCGGDRDRSKRPLMGKISAEFADITVITSDNPRSEDPQGIIDDILQGIKIKRRKKCISILDRYQAIRRAFILARCGDIVLIAGKGHERNQIMQNKILDFDDYQVAKEILLNNGFDS
ncbi:MAG: UDP-N-acetylmuramoyl-L-alanyl-D-glutamate--2,6-diaminopimelate ligase [Candidatus Omnitrophota bacterium]